MKVLLYIVAPVIFLCVTLACDVNQSGKVHEVKAETPENLTAGAENNAKEKKFWMLRNPGVKQLRVIPFEGSFFTTPEGNPRPDERCSAPTVLDTQTGEGKAKYLGPFRFHSTFCIDLTDLVDDGKLSEGEALPFYGSVTTFTFANGDKLYARGNDAVLPSDKPDFSAEFSNPFVFIGGTGRFKGAKGGGTTSSSVIFGAGTSHEFSGVLVLSLLREDT